MKRMQGVCAASLVAAALALATEARAQSIAIDWNQVALEAVALNPPAPTLTTWRLHMMSIAMYDAWTAYDAHATGYVNGNALQRPTAEHTTANQESAVSHAAFRILTTVFPNQRSLFEDTMAELGYSPPFDSGDLSSPVGVGNAAARGVLQWCLDDRSNFQNGFTELLSDAYPQPYTPVNAADPDAPNAPGGPRFDPNRWQPLRVPNGALKDPSGNPIFDNDDPSTYTDQRFVTSHWGAVRPFALASGDQLRPPPPPRQGSSAPYVDALGQAMTEDEAWNLQVDEVLMISATLGDREKVIAQFWADGPRTWTPPGHWNQLAQGLSIRDGHDLADDVKMFFALNGALFDAGIAAWEAKRAYDYVRPVSAIRHKYRGQMIEGWGGPGRGTRRMRGEDWLPFQELNFVTPAFAEFVSGHSSFSRAGREVLRAFTGSDALYDGATRLDADYDGDGELDLVGQHVALPGSVTIDRGSLGFATGSLTPRESVVLRWPTLLEAAEEAGISRLYGGIHFMDGNLRGQELGRQVGLRAFEFARGFWGEEENEPGPGTRSRVSRGPSPTPAPAGLRAAAVRPGRARASRP